MTAINMLKLEMKRTYLVAPERLFAAWTEPEQLTQWFGCKETQCISAKVEPKVGGAYQINTKSEKHGTITMSGEIRDFDPPNKLAFTFAWTGNEEVESMPPTLVTVHFREVTGGTELELIHTEVPCQEMRDSVNQGWSDSLEKLQGFVS